MSNLAKIIFEEYQKKNIPHQFALLSAVETPNHMSCLKEFSEIVFCLNKTDDYLKCGQKYELFTECFKKYYITKGTK
tara:strand:- start:48 stop:278 length:231 start_codon:yes stop_codon:yes gene_type:complete